MEQPQQRRTLFEPEPSAFAEKTPERVVVVAQPVVAQPVEKELPPPAEIVEPIAPEKARFNPWLAALWVLGIVSIAAALLTNWDIYEQSMISSELDESYYMFISIMQTFMPWLFGVGLAAIVAAVTIHALDWQRRHT
jgi:hypothetical protein